MIYIASGCLKDNADIFRVLDTYGKLGIKNVELGSQHRFFPDISKLFAIQKDYGFNYIIHGYFPPQQEPLWINLASKNKAILSKSRKVVTDAIDLCRKLGSPLYSFHGGYRCDFDKSLKPVTKALPPDETLALLAEQVAVVCDYAAEYGINIALENMNATLPEIILNTHEEIASLLDMINCKNLGVLIDVGHLKVASTVLKFDRKEFIRNLKAKIFELHVHDNHGIADDHLMPKDASILQDFRGIDLSKIPVTLESQKLTDAEIISSKKILEKAIKQ